jgi:hypothetical protein
MICCDTDDADSLLSKTLEELRLDCHALLSAPTPLLMANDDSTVGGDVMTMTIRKSAVITSDEI